jgi:hypothetical protein
MCFAWKVKKKMNEAPREAGGIRLGGPVQTPKNVFV